MSFEKYCKKEGTSDTAPLRDMWNAAQKEARDECSNTLGISRSSAQLMAGEMTAQEWRTLAAVLKALQSRMI